MIDVRISIAHLDMVQLVSCNLAKDIVCLLGVVAARAALGDHCGGAGHAGRQGGARGGTAVEGSLQVLELESELDCRQSETVGVSTRAGTWVCARPRHGGWVWDSCST